MEHHFNVDIAIKFGMDVATFLQNIAFWTHHNIANKKHFIDGRYWIYNTQEAWTVLFPYWTRQNIRTIVKKCTDNDLIVLGKYNDKKYDKTCWYSLTDKALELFPILQKSLGWNQPRDVDNSEKPWLESTNGLVGINQPIPDSNPNIKQKSFCENEEQKKIKNYNNSKKHEWVTQKHISTFSDPTKQSTSYQPSKHLETYAPMPDYVRQLYKKPKPGAWKNEFAENRTN